MNRVESRRVQSRGAQGGVTTRPRRVAEEVQRGDPRGWVRPLAVDPELLVFTRVDEIGSVRGRAS